MTSNKQKENSQMAKTAILPPPAGFEPIESIFADLEVSAIAEYRQAVNDMAEGRQINSKGIGDILAKASRTLDDMRADVARVRERIEAAADLRQAEKLRPDIVKAHETVLDASKTVDEIKARYEIELRHAESVKTEALTTWRNLKDRANRLQRDGSQILRSSTPAGVVDAIQARKAELRDLENQAREISDRLAADDSVMAGRNSDDPRRKADAFKAETMADEAYSRLKHRLGPIRQRADEIRAEIDALEQSRLDPLNW